jgi:E3 ubiquitin-protein ligase ATL23
MIGRLFITVLVSLMFLCASTGIVITAYFWLVWYFPFHEIRRPPLEDNVKLPKQQGLSKADLQLLPTIECHGGGERPSEGDGNECAVCLEPFQSGQRCRVIPACSHAFHVHCADAWLSRRSVCPICRRSAACETEEKNGGAAAALQKEEGRDEESRRRPQYSAESVVVDMPIAITLEGYIGIL